MLPTTLAKALDEVAHRSFYENVIITPQNDGTYQIEDDWNSIPDDLFYWYENALCSDYPLEEYEISGLMDPMEFFDNFRQIEHYLPKAAAALLEGQTVSFSYLIIRDEDVDEDEDADAGWLLAARILP